MEEYMKGNGLMVNNMEKGCIQIRMGSNVRVVGQMENEFTQFKNPSDFNLNYYGL